MSDLFAIVPKNTGRPRTSKGKEDAVGKYTVLQGEFLGRSYGYYATYFIQKIAAEAITQCPQIEVLSINRILKELVRKFLLSDLELVFVGYVAGQLQWTFAKSFYKQRCQTLKLSSEPLHKGIQSLNFFLHLCASFVKNYIGQLQEAAAINDFLASETAGEWQGTYEEWLKMQPSELFKLSPRTINTIFSNYSRDCQKGVKTKNYNCMVDRILELSTTYSMIPGAEGKHKKQEIEVPEESSNGRKIIKKNMVEGNVSNITKKDESYLNDHNFFESRLSSNFIDSKPKQTPQELKQPKQGTKRGLLRLRTKNQPVSNHITEFYSKKQYDMPGGREEFRPESTIGFQNSIPSLLDFNNRSSVYEAIPYTLRNNSNLSNFWK